MQPILIILKNSKMVFILFVFKQRFARRPLASICNLNPFRNSKKERPLAHLDQQSVNIPPGQFINSFLVDLTRADQKTKEETLIPAIDFR